MPSALSRGLRAIARAGRRLRRNRRTTRSGGRRMLRGSRMSKRGLAGLIRKVLNRSAETKYVADNYDKNGAQDLPAVWNLNNLGAGVLKFVPMIPRTAQGTDENNRIGDQISPVGNCVTTLDFAYNDTDLSGHQIKVEIWYGTTKERKSWGPNNPLITNAFLDNGDGTNVAPGIGRQTTMLPTDKRMVSFKKKVFILSKSSGTTGGPGGTSNFSANAGRSFHSLKLVHKPPKKLKYTNGADNYPSNYAPGYYINLTYADGLVANQPEIQGLVNITSRTHLHFKDM